MSLTQTDLKAIQGIIVTTVQPMIDTAVTQLQGEITDSIDSLAQSTAAGFAEVHEKLAEHDQHFEKIDNSLKHMDVRFDRVDSNLERIEHKLGVTIERVDNHSIQLQRLQTNIA